MKKYLILVKHSLPEVVENLRAREWKLSGEGCIRALRLAEQLNSFHPGVIVSSIEPKAKETAEILASKVKLKLHVADGLQEHYRTETPFLSKDQFQLAIREFFENPDTLVFGGETANEAHTRFSKSVKAILNDYANKTIVIVSHGTVISLFVSYLTGISDMLLWSELGLPSYVVLDMQTKRLIARENTV